MERVLERTKVRPRAHIKCLKNKVASVIMLLVGTLTALMTLWFEGQADLTVFIFTLIFAIPLFFAKRNYVDF
jgi:hypothetical protein